MTTKRTGGKMRIVANAEKIAKILEELARARDAAARAMQAATQQVQFALAAQAADHQERAMMVLSGQELWTAAQQLRGNFEANPHAAANGTNN